ncbi:MAG TPA: HlyD family efflux transporter periplasmic adaptor subunit [Prosthecobacter sp.]|nr:HlyD family efflux transporter periplasmic adaptor subunit [Prosthecobacter sp.]
MLLLPAWTVPAFLILALGTLFVLVFRDRLLPATPVNAAVAILLTDIELPEHEAAPAPATAAQSSPVTGAPPPDMLFQAGGWFEPDPLPIYAIALTDGVISKVHVLEGQEVKKGQLLAELIPDDARIALSAARRSQERAVAEAQLQKVQVSVAEADAAAMADLVKAGEAQLEQERDNLMRVERTLEGSVSGQERARAKFAVQGQLAAVAASKSQHLAALAKVEAARAQSAVLEAAVAVSKVEMEKAQLAFSRTQIHSPVDGVILELHAAPGQKKLLAMDNHLSATVATLFETGKLQARVDVPLADARGLLPGQEAVITSDFLPNQEFRGVVTRIVGAANLQRNTLQAKVRVIDPDPRLRPEMLCRVKFLAGGGVAAERTQAKTSSGTAGATDEARAVMVPEDAVTREGPTAVVWAIAADGTSAERRNVIVGSVKRDGYVGIASGVLPGELVILPPHDRLSQGTRVKPTLVSP